MKYFKCFILFTLFFCINACYANKVVPTSNFDSNKYLGDWYEIARLPNRFEKNCVAPINANYSLNPKNILEIIVVNKCSTKEHKINIAHGVANFVDSMNIGKLKVTFLPKLLRWLSFGYGDYWVLYTDYSNISVVGSPDYKYLWILARRESINQTELKNAIEIAKHQGFDISKLIFNY